MNEMTTDDKQHNACSPTMARYWRGTLLVLPNKLLTTMRITEVLLESSRGTSFQTMRY